MIRYAEHLNGEQLEIAIKAINMGRGEKFTGQILNLPMGFGKTRTMAIIGLNLYGNFLVICSKTLIDSWTREIDHVFKGKISYEILHKDYIGKNMMMSWKLNLSKRIIITTPDVVMASYKYNNISDDFIKTVDNVKYYCVPRDPYGDEVSYGFENIHRMDWSGVIVDEFHNYTNYETSKCQAIASIASRHKWLLSGTPLPEPKISRIFGTLLLLNCKEPNNLQDCKQFVMSDKFKGLNAYSIVVDPQPLKDCKLHENYRIYSLNIEEKQCYQLFKSIIKKWTQYYHQKKEELGGNDTNVRQIRGHMISILTYLRQALVDPSIGLNNLINKIKDHPQLRELYKKSKEMFKRVSIVSNRYVVISDILKEHKNDKVLVFGSYALCLKSCYKYCLATYPEINVFSLTGKMSGPERNEVLRKFRQSDNGILFLTYQLGSEGLNLQEASVVIHLDLYWNKNKEDQAARRCYRLGQKSKTVYQYYIISNTGFEKGLLDRHKSKLKMIKELAVGSPIKTTIKGIKYLDMVQLLDLEQIEISIEDRNAEL